MLQIKLTEAIKRLALNLHNKVVLTEAATGAYAVTAVLAALAGAKVYAFAKPTRYGTTEQAFAEVRKVAQLFKQIDLDITFIDTLLPEIIAQADIITNSGHLRPLDKTKLQYAKEGVVIPIMYEAWELREQDVDVAYCKYRNILLGATNERHPDVGVFEYLGDMAIKLILDAGICLQNNKFILVCNNEFGPYIAKVLARNCKSLGIIDIGANKSTYQFKENVSWLGEFPNLTIPSEFIDADAVIFTAYPFTKTWIGKDTPISAEQICKQLYAPYILRYAGDIDTATLDRLGINYYPPQVPPGHMGVLPSAIGYDPVIRLQAGGLKVGELLLNREISDEAEKLVQFIS